MSSKVAVLHSYPSEHGMWISRYQFNMPHWDVGRFYNHQQGTTKWWRRYPDSSTPIFGDDGESTVFIDHEYGWPNLDDWHNAIHRHVETAKLICYGINTFVDRTSPLSHLNPLCDLVNATKVHVSADLYPSNSELERSDGVNYRSRVQRRKDMLKYIQDQTRQMSYQVISPVHGRAPNGYQDGVLFHDDWIKEQVNNLDTTMGVVVFAAAGSAAARKIVDPALLEMMRLVDIKYSLPTNTTPNGNGRMF